MYKMLGKIVQIVHILGMLPVVFVQGCWAWVVCAEQYLVRLVQVLVHMNRYIYAYTDLYNLYNLYNDIYASKQQPRHGRMRVKGGKFFLYIPP
jgi:hypothetical protein